MSTQTPVPPDYGQPVQQSTGFAVTSLVTGIVGLVFAWVPFLGVVLGVIAVTFGGISLRRGQQGKAGGKGMAVAGLVTGILAVAVFAVLAIAAATSSGNRYGY